MVKLGNPYSLFNHIIYVHYPRCANDISTYDKHMFASSACHQNKLELNN